MSDRYAKLFGSITESTIWGEPAGTRLVWITMLAKSNRSGEVFGSIPGFARLANVSLQECEAAMATLLAPDLYSRTPDNEGRRIEKIDGGWKILNHAKFDRMRSEIEAEERERERKRQWDRDNRPDRPNAKHRTPDVPPTTPDAAPTRTPDVPPTNPDAPPTQPDGPLALALALPRSKAKSKAAVCVACASTPDVPPTKSDTRSRVVEASMALNAKGVRTTPSNPDLIAAIEEGVTVQELTDMAANYPQKPAGYVISAARRQRAEGSTAIVPIARGSAPAPSRSRTMQAIQVLEQVKINARLDHN